MRILLTGANGQVAHDVIVVSKNYSVELLACDKNQLDITNIDSVNQIVNQFKPDVIINTAAYTQVDKAETEIELAYAINAKGPENLALVCKQKNILLFHLSTDYVFDGKKTSAYVETDLPCPTSIYGKSKLAGEEAIIAIAPNYFILRVSWVFGEHGNNFVKTMRRLAETHNELKVVNDQHGGPTPARAIAETIFKILFANHGWNEIYHYCGSPIVSWYEFAKAILPHKKIIPITTAEFPRPATRPQNSALDCDKIFNEFGITPADWRKALDAI